MKIDRVLTGMLYWLSAYVAILTGISWIGGRPLEVVPVLSNLISGFAGAAFAIMRSAAHDSNDSKDAKKDGESR